MSAETRTDVRPGSGGMFDRIAGSYDGMNRLISFGQDRRWRRHLVAAVGELGAGGEALDLATGTADVAIAVARKNPDCKVIGLDPSVEMLAVGRQKVTRSALDAQIELVEGDAQALTFADARFAACTIAFGIRNVPDRRAALREMVRVLRPGGLVAVLELSEPRAPGPLGSLARLHVRHIVPRMGVLAAGAEEYRYLQRSIAAFPQPEAFVEEMQTAGLCDVAATPLSMGAVQLFVGRVAAVTS